MNTKSILYGSDSYKITHWRQYPPGTEYIYSYFEARGGEFDETVFFGLQYFLKRYLQGQVIQNIDEVEEAADFYEKHFGSYLFNTEGWNHILRDHAGRLPVSIKAVPEGTVVPTRNALMTVENTCPECYWLTNYLETLLVQVWYPMTVATLSRDMKKMILGHLEKTGDPESIGFKLHDFGFRGVSSWESAGLGGMAHLVNFLGTDTAAALTFAREYYGEEMAGFSIPASEHSTITSWGEENEGDAFENMLDQFPTGLVACVSDSYDIESACENLWGTRLKEKILARDGTLVVRPDSGDPTDSVLGVLKVLGEKFGTEINEKGFKVLPPQIRVIQGDGVDRRCAVKILSVMNADGWSADNLAFGMGGALLQKCHRDTSACAFKCSGIVVNGEERPVFKDPKTAPEKRSKRGWLALVRDAGAVDGWATHEYANRTVGVDTAPSELVEVFRDGELLIDQTFEEVRGRAQV